MLAVSGTPVPLKKQFALVRDTYKIVIRLLNGQKHIQMLANIGIYRIFEYSFLSSYIEKQHNRRMGLGKPL